MEFSAPRFMISGAFTGVGKSIFGLGLAVALRKRNIGLSCCVKGPNLLQANIYHRLSRRFTRTFDDQLLDSGQILLTLRQASIGAELVMIEGESGLYDGIRPGVSAGSDAALAAALSTPVIVVLNPGRYGASLAAVCKGFESLARDCKVAGFVANRLGKTPEQSYGRMKPFFDSALQAHGMDSLLGGIPEREDLVALARGRDSWKESGEIVFPRQFLIGIGELVEANFDIDQLVAIAASARPLMVEAEDEEPRPRRCRIGVADDSCFNVCFQDNFDLLRLFGAQLVSFSPLADSHLPSDLGALYFPGANLLEYREVISANEEMKEAIREFARQGGVIYSEGAGTAYLCNEFVGLNSAEPGAGVGIIGASAFAQEPFLSYTESVSIDETIFGPKGRKIKGISANNWILENDANVFKSIQLAFGAERPVLEGYSSTAQVLATFCFNHLGSNPSAARSIVDAAEVVCKMPSGPDLEEE